MMFKSRFPFLLAVCVFIFAHSCVPEPLPPENVKVKTQSTNSLKISWDPVPNASRYSIFRSEKFEGDYSVIGTVETNDYLDEGLAEGRLYFYKVVSENSTKSDPSARAWGVACDTTKDAIYAIFDGYYVTGKVFYHESLEDKRIVWWVLTDIWYIQPQTAGYYTPIDSEGCFRRGGHLGVRAHIILTKPDGPLPSQVRRDSSWWGVTPLLELYVDRTGDGVEVVQEAASRTLTFSGYEWKVKSSETEVGPGPNYFSDREEDVWVDEDGQLHLKITERDGRWYCTEVFTEASLGYGKYIFYLASRVDQLDKNIVVGLFTWDDAAPEYNYREIDIEFSKWGQTINDNAQYVVQPWDRPGNIKRFNMDLNGDYSTHIFDWGTDSIFFQSLHGHYSSPPADSYIFESWTYTGSDIPPAGKENVRINLWLMTGTAPSDGKDAGIVIKKFEFVP